MNFLEESRNKLVHFLFPFVERFYLVTSLVLLLAAWFIPYWQLRVVSFLLWYGNSEIHWAGIMERDYLPIQQGSSLFYHIYRFIDGMAILFLPAWLVILLVPVSQWLKSSFGVVLILLVILRAIGEYKYRPKKPEE